MWRAARPSEREEAQVSRLPQFLKTHYDRSGRPWCQQHGVQKLFLFSGNIDKITCVTCRKLWRRQVDRDTRGKLCGYCRNWLPISRFSRNRSMGDGLKYICKRCTNIRTEVRKGRPEFCSKCNARCKPEGHHEDYNKLREVVWLCRPCHLAISGKLPRFFVEGDPQ